MPIGGPLKPAKQKRIQLLNAAGHTDVEIARRLGIHPATVSRWRRKFDAEREIGGGERAAGGSESARRKALLAQGATGGPLCVDAERALADFGYFQRRYFGRVAVPWQVEAANRVVELLASPDEEYAVINAPPGSGKSTTFTLDIAAWVTCRNRAVRGLIGSRTDKQAKWYLGRLRREFERTAPLKAKQDLLARGEALDALATMAGDFGRFRPTERDVWSAEQFVVAQADGQAISEKESTWTAVGMDTSFLGGRFDLCLWDDLVDLKSNSSPDSREAIEKWWDEYAETRLEPGGLLVLQGQRLGPEDLYRYSLDKLAGFDDYDYDEDADDEEVPAGTARKYHHIVFKAHYDECCERKHRRDSPAYGEPGGCLLYPRRLGWTKLLTLKRNNERTYEVLYQQADVDPTGVLVQQVWVDGGIDPRTGVSFPGCWDADRDVAELYDGLAGEMFSVAMVDPSPSKFWAALWICYQPATEQRFYMDLARQKMDAPDFIDWDYGRGCFTGLMEEWQQRSVDLGRPIQAWIVEANAAQKFMLQYDHVRRWQMLRGVDIVPHTTYVNKADPTYGVECLAPHWRFGRVRLPGAGQGRATFSKLVEEVTRWRPGGGGSATDDCLMASWFFEWQLPRIWSPELADGAGEDVWRPSWLTG